MPNPRKTRQQIKKNIADSTKSTELKEAETKIATEDISIDSKTERQIREDAETPEDAMETIDELTAEKKHKLALKEAKSQINDATPVGMLIAKPSYGPTVGRVYFHTRYAYSFILGRERKDKPKIMGILQAASQTKNLVQAHHAGCLYATWMIIKIEEQIDYLKSLVTKSEKESKALINHVTSLTLEPFTSKKPTPLDLTFVTVYGFHYADILSRYDQIMREVLSYELNGFISRDELIAIEKTLGTPLRKLLRMGSEWSFVGREAIETKNAIFMEAENKMGILPKEIIEGTKTPKLTRNNMGRKNEF